MCSTVRVLTSLNSVKKIKSCRIVCHKFFICMYVFIPVKKIINWYSEKLTLMKTNSVISYGQRECVGESV